MVGLSEKRRGYVTPGASGQDCHCCAVRWESARQTVGVNGVSGHVRTPNLLANRQPIHSERTGAPTPHEMFVGDWALALATPSSCGSAAAGAVVCWCCAVTAFASRDLAAQL